MLSCEQVTAKASALLDGGLSRRERMAVRLHLLMCVHCRRFERQLRKLVVALRKRDPVVPVDQTFIDLVVERMDSASNHRNEPQRT